MGLVRLLKKIGPIRPPLEKIQAKIIEVRMRNKLGAYAAKVAASEIPPYLCERKTLALIITCFNHAPFLPLAIKSVEAQTRMPDEIIFVEDNSSDSTRDIISQFKRDRAGLNIITHFNEKNMGQAYSLNKAIASAKSDLVMILNDDDYLMHNAVEIGLGLMQKHSNIHLCGFGCEVFRDDSQVGRHSTTAEVNYDGFVVKTPQDVSGYRAYNDINMTHTSSIFTKYAWQVVGGYYPEKQRRVVPFSDRDFQLRVNCHFPIGIFPNMKMAFWREGSSVDAGINS